MTEYLASEKSFTRLFFRKAESQKSVKCPGTWLQPKIQVEGKSGVGGSISTVHGWPKTDL